MTRETVVNLVQGGALGYVAGTVTETWPHFFAVLVALVVAFCAEDWK